MRAWWTEHCDGFSQDILLGSWTGEVIVSRNMEDEASSCLLGLSASSPGLRLSSLTMVPTGRMSLPFSTSMFWPVC